MNYMKKYKDNTYGCQRNITWHIVQIIAVHIDSTIMHMCVIHEFYNAKILQVNEANVKSLKN